MMGFLFKKDKAKEKEEINQIKSTIQNDDALQGALPPIPSAPQSNQQALNEEKKEIKKDYAPLPSSDAPTSPTTQPSENAKNEDTKLSSASTNTQESSIDSLFSPESNISLSNSSRNDDSTTTTNDVMKDSIFGDDGQPLVQNNPGKEEQSQDVFSTAEVEVKGSENVLLKNLNKERVISPPLFISVKKYREIVNELVALKVSLATLESVLEMSKKSYVAENEHIREFVDELEKLNHRMKYFSEIFKLK